MLGMLASEKRFLPPLLALCLVLLPLFCTACLADEVKEQSLTGHVRRQISLLSHSNFRVRETASWELSKYPKQALTIIEAELPGRDFDTCERLVDYLTELALGPDLELGIRSRAILNVYSQDASSLGKRASNSLYAISELQEEEAIEILTYQKAVLGPRTFQLNASTQTGNEFSLQITDSFEGGDEAIQRIRYLKSVETIYLRGEKVDSRIFDAIAALRGVRNIKIRDVKMTADDLKAFRNLDNLELLELNYVDLDDSCIPILAELPISQAMRLYGTKITQAGAEELRLQLDGLDIYCGRGGFLGVGTNGGNIVTTVVGGSAAQYAGLERGDRLLAINGQPINSFEELRAELGKCVVDDKVKVRFKRKTEIQEIEVVLTADPP